MPSAAAWPVAEGLAGHEEDAKDLNLPLMIWYGIEPLVPADTDRAAALLMKAKIPLVREYIARRIAAGAEWRLPMEAFAMRWSERIIESPADTPSARGASADRRGALIARECGTDDRNGGDPRHYHRSRSRTNGHRQGEPAGAGFHVLADLALTDPSLRCHLSELAKHRLASVRQGWPSIDGRELRPIVTNAVYRELLRDKAASDRRTTIEQWACMHARTCCRTCARSGERNEQVIRASTGGFPCLRLATSWSRTRNLAASQSPFSREEMESRRDQSI